VQGIIEYSRNIDIDFSEKSCYTYHHIGSNLWIRPMKPLLVFIFTMLTVVVYAEMSALPPVRPVDEQVSPHIPLFYTVKKQMETSIIPQPLAPLLPPQRDEQVPAIIRGQARTTVNDLPGILASPPPLARGVVDAEMIDPKLTEPLGASETAKDVFGSDPWKKPDSLGASASGTKTADPAGYALLIFASAITTIGLIYMIFVAYDYRQRWVQSLTTQNDRYLGVGTFDTEMENTYNGSVPFSDGLGLPRSTI
jgi:hypothetical protein